MQKKICLSIDQMQKLKELGVETKDASMYWVHLINYNNSLNTSIDEHILSFNKPELYLAIGVHSKIDDRGTKEFIKDITPAFTLQDILDQLPKRFQFKMDGNCGRYCDLEIQKLFNGWNIMYTELGYDVVYLIESEFLLGGAFDMLVWLAKEGYLKGESK